jgi:hypothetical protein
VRLSIALVLCAALVATMSFVPPRALQAAAPHVAWLRLLAGAAVVADARRLGLARYATGLGTNALVWFALASLWPAVVLPWYLTVRECVRSGLTPVRGARGESDPPER